MDRCGSTLALMNNEQVESDGYSSGYESTPESTTPNQNPASFINRESVKIKEKMSYKNIQALTEYL